MITETIISTNQHWCETIQIVDQVTYEHKEGKTYKITKRIKRITKKIKPGVAHRRSLAKFGQAAKPGNDEVTTIGHEIFIEPPPSQIKKNMIDSSYKPVRAKVKSGWGNLLSKTAKTRETGKKTVKKGFSSWMHKTQKPDEEWKRTLFVTNIPTNTQNDEAHDFVTSTCTHRPTRVHVIRNRDTGICYGNMIVVFNRKSIAKQAMNELSGQRWGSSIINAQISKPKEKRRR